MLTFRQAVQEDITDILRTIYEARAAIATLGIDQWQTVTDFSPLVTKDLANGNGYIMDEDGHAVAYAALIDSGEPVYDTMEGTWNTAEDYLTVHRVAVDDAHRHAGLSAKFFAEIKVFAKAKGLHGIRIDTHRGNVVMRRFLQKQGFRECGLMTYPDITKADPYRVGLDFVIGTED